MRKGQALVIVLLILGIAVTVGLSIMSRSITEVSVSTTSDESAKALEAAEAGVEQALGGVLVGAGGTGSLPQTSSTYEVSNSSIAGASNVAYAVPYRLSHGDTVTVALTGVDKQNNSVSYGRNKVYVCWGTGGDNSALEAILYFEDSGVKVARTGFSPTGSNGFVTAQNGCPNISGYNYDHQGTIDIQPLITNGKPLFLRLRILGNNSSQPLVVAPRTNGTFPVQGKDVVSTGQSGSANQKLHVVQSNPDLPFMFDMAVFGGTSVTQESF